MLAPKLLFVFAGAWLSVEAIPKCSDGYSSSHTLCKTDVGPILTMSSAEQQAILDQHNDYRSLEEASDMLKLRWSDDLATVAAKWAAQCTPGHDDKTERALITGDLVGVYIGQNAARGYSSFQLAAEGWWNETVDFTYGQAPPSDPDRPVKHYTQIVWAETSLLGCGKADCTGKFAGVPASYTFHNYVCNYASGGNFNFAAIGWKPYKEDSGICGECNGQCDNNLCDCPFLVCKNGGKFRATDDCGCDCSATNYGGSTCTDLESCPAGYQEAPDATCDYYFNYCSTTLSRNEEQCCGYLTNVMNECKIRCGLCAP